MDNSEKYLIKSNKTIKDALEQINNLPSLDALVLFVLNENKEIIGSITDGDIRRALLNNIKLNDNITLAMKQNFHYITNFNCYKKIKNFQKLNLKIIPLVTKEKKLIKFINLQTIKAILPIDAIIMAGGLGTRLKPYTDKTPKSLLKLNNKTIITHNIDRLISFGVKNFYITVNYLKEQVIDHLNEYYKNSDINLYFIEENEPLGTIGSVKLINNFKNKDILLINSDILTNINFDDFFSFYKKEKADMCVATFNIKYDFPYAILKTNGQQVCELEEKPTYTYYSNAGIYLFNKELTKYIPQNKMFHTIDFINTLIKENKNVIHFQIRDYWLDIGTKENYLKAKEDIQHIDF